MSNFQALADAAMGIINSTFGTPVTYIPNVGSSVSIRGVFDNAYVEVSGVSSLRPTLRINLSDLASAPTKGDQVEVNSKTYDVIASEEDGLGGSTLILQEE